MTGITAGGMRLLVEVDSEGAATVMLGISRANARTTSAYALSSVEARNLANWLNGAADEADGKVRP